MSLRIAPEAALRPGNRDAFALLGVWFVRKSFYWLLGLGIIVAAFVGRVDEIGDSLDSPGAASHRLLSPLVAVILALVCRLGSSLAALVLAYPLARNHELGLAPRTSFGSSIGRWFDRLHVARAYRSLRWTHHVRQKAIERLGRTGARLSYLDPIMDVANISLLVGAVVVLSVVGAGNA